MNTAQSAGEESRSYRENQLGAVTSFISPSSLEPPLISGTACDQASPQKCSLPASPRQTSSQRQEIFKGVENGFPKKWPPTW